MGQSLSHSEWSLDHYDASTSNNRSQSEPSYKTLLKQARTDYERSLATTSRNEHAVMYRSSAKAAALKLIEHKPSTVIAMNLLARIALDEGFYTLAKDYLTQALSIHKEDSGCWYSLGHVHLATKDYSTAISCFTNALDIAPDQTRAQSSLAYTLAQQGQIVPAFQSYRSLFHHHPLDQHIQAKLFDVVSQLKADTFRVDLEQDAIAWLKVPNTHHQSLANFVLSLLGHKYQLSDPQTVIDLQDLAKDELFKLALGKLLFTEPTLEQFLISIRKQALLHSIAGEYKDINLLHLAEALSIQAEHNEHILAYDTEEKDIVDTIKELLSVSIQSNASLPAFSHLITLYAMYEPLWTPMLASALTKIEFTDWPEYTRNLMQIAIVDRQEINQWVNHIRQLGSIENPMSIQVKQQYEENPYPRWLHLGYNTPTNYGRTLERELEGFKAPAFFNMGTIKVLIAGSGTGQHALRVAKYFRNVDVLAIDLSQQAMAYAKRMATLHNISNVRFLCADILELADLDETFHVIECSGVLHHMESPKEGLNALVSKLKPKGLLKLGLYSQQARSVVNQIRKVINSHQLPATRKGIRHLRQALLNDHLPVNTSVLLNSEDFYSTSGCRDLLFHIQEHQFDPIGLKKLLHNAELSFLGFIIPDTVRQNYLTMFPEDEQLRSLKNWQQFERKHPQTFASMFQFYVQRDG